MVRVLDSEHFMHWEERLLRLCRASAPVPGGGCCVTTQPTQLGSQTVILSTIGVLSKMVFSYIFDVSVVSGGRETFVKGWKLNQHWYLWLSLVSLSRVGAYFQSLMSSQVDETTTKRFFCKKYNVCVWRWHIGAHRTIGLWGVLSEWLRTTKLIKFRCLLWTERENPWVAGKGIWVHRWRMGVTTDSLLVISVGHQQKWPGPTRAALGPFGCCTRCSWRTCWGEIEAKRPWCGVFTHNILNQSPGNSLSTHHFFTAEVDKASLSCSLIPLWLLAMNSILGPLLELDGRIRRSFMWLLN